jgi:hypothetical protein
VAYLVLRQILSAATGTVGVVLLTRESGPADHGLYEAAFATYTVTSHPSARGPKKNGRFTAKKPSYLPPKVPINFHRRSPLLPLENHL